MTARMRILVVLLLVAAAGCTSHGASKAADPAARSSTTRGGVVLLTQADGANLESSFGGGVLRFYAARRCVYLERPDGTRLLPQWPEGYHALPDPLRVYNAANALVAKEGSVVTFGGGFHDPAGTRLGRREVRSQRGRRTVHHGVAGVPAYCSESRLIDSLSCARRTTRVTATIIGISYHDNKGKPIRNPEQATPLRRLGS